MENSKIDLDSSRSYNNTEMQFLQKVKECQHHLQCMEKLFVESLNVTESDRQLSASHISLNNFKKLNDQKHKSSNSSPDLQQLLQEFETKYNNTFKGEDSARSQKGEPFNIELQSVNKDTNLSTLTFVVQVPNSVLDVVKKKSESDCTLQCHAKQISKTNKKAGFTWLQKLFNRNSKTSVSSRKSETLEALECLNKKTYSDSNSSRNIDILDKYTASKNISNASSISKEGPNLVFPIIYDFDEKIEKAIWSNATIQQNIKPQTNEVPCSVNNSKASGELNKEATQPKGETKRSLNQESQMTEILLESLIKALLRTTEKLNELENLKSLVNKHLSEKEIQTKKSHHCCKNIKVKDSKEQKVLNHFLQHVMEDIETKINDSRTVKSKKKNVQQHYLQIPKRQSSKLSVCSSNGASSLEELYNKNSVILKPKHIQRHSRCHSPSMLNYLVCQSERDID